MAGNIFTPIGRLFGSRNGKKAKVQSKRQMKKSLQSYKTIRDQHKLAARSGEQELTIRRELEAAEIKAFQKGNQSQTAKEKSLKTIRRLRQEIANKQEALAIHEEVIRLNTALIGKIENSIAIDSATVKKNSIKKIRTTVEMAKDSFDDLRDDADVSHWDSAINTTDNELDDLEQELLEGIETVEEPATFASVTPVTEEIE